VNELREVAHFLFAVASAAVKSDRVIDGSLAESPAKSAEQWGLLFSHQLRQLGDIRRDPPRF
jgi:hypothetical protein